MTDQPEMSTETALALAVLVLDFEAETAQENRIIWWAMEARKAARVIRQLKGTLADITQGVTSFQPPKQHQ
jgi:hypothetical protein